MNRLKNLLQYDASKFIHVGIVGVLYILTKTSYIAYLILIPEVLFLLKKSKNIIIYSLIIVFAVSLRIHQIDRFESESNFPINGVVTQVFDDHFYLKTDQLLLCYYDNMEIISPGLNIQIDGNHSQMDAYDIPHTFDYELYLKSVGIDQVVYVNSLQVIQSTFRLELIPYRITQYIDHTFIKETASYLKLFILGNSNDYNEFDRDVFVHLGISHLFAISGMHLGFIIGFLSLFLKKFYLTKETNQIVIMIFLIVYNIITGFKISIIRASLLIAGIYLTDLFHILLSKTDLLTFSLVLLIIINPYYVYSIGFQLSYLIAFSILLCDYLFQEDSKLSKMVKVTVLATLISLPITLEMNQSLGLIFVFANIFFILYVSLLFLPMSILTLFFPFLQSLYGICMIVFEQAVEVFSNVNIIIHFNFSMPIYQILYWAIVLLSLVYIKHKKKLILLGISLMVVLLSSIFVNYKSAVFVRFLDVSQGDAIHIHDHGCDLLIDTGKPDNYDNLVRYFQGNNTRQIDILLITHFHSDHYGELEDIINQLSVGTLYLNQSHDISKKYIISKEGDCFSCGNSKFQVLSSYTGSSNENNNSIVLFAEIAGIKYLFTGDMETEIEQKILDTYQFEIDILKVPHHGSITSSTNEFLETMDGNIAILSVGKNNRYGLPDEPILDRLLHHNYQIYRTDFDGTITIYHYEFLNYYMIETFQLHKHNRYIL